ncbi:hypothetical protein [Vagococcus xieshaowenii]|uniref:Uncharacterized protein n=1 Tax=Vagococcus xieshaowenii TaxID=2562451 RepID=A0AAJ5EFU1_9ENTE|nr:hypothetical protein [Vagococcus xieshaowenii]QCA29664.1 hypothetical protein E4Z98_09770 [Vagococcus xieshaowenii]TFZ42939.1 hypothetical protein E4031_01510 [Vagococcus xieshaowenii]
MTNTQAGAIKRMNKRKGYQSIPRSFLQDENISLEAIGLLCNMESMPDNWVFYKTELMSRFKFNKRTSITRIWDELVREGYIVQFRKRSGKKFEYQYIFSLEKFSPEELTELLEEMKTEGFSLYLKNNDDINIKATSKKTSNSDETNDFWTVGFEQSKMDTPKPTSIKLTTKKLTTKKEEDIYTPTRDKQSFSTLSSLLKKYPDMSPVVNYLKACDLNPDDVYKITIALINEPYLINQQAIIEQMQWATMKAKYEGVYDFVKYFLDGLRKKIETRSYSTHNDVETLFSEENNTTADKPKIPMFNWLEN